MKEFVIGHETTINKLKEMVEKNRLPHALIFSGKEAIGKKRVALILASMLLCEKKSACMKCSICKRIVKLYHPDVILVTPAKESISIFQIRELQQWSSLKPMEANIKLAIIDDAHLMTVQAANAFLKTLEEPPLGTHFILITHALNRLPSTILSRCLILNFKALNKKEIEKICDINIITGVKREICEKTESFIFSQVEDKKLSDILNIAKLIVNNPSSEILGFMDTLGKRFERNTSRIFLYLIRKILNERLKKEKNDRLFKLHELLSFVEECSYNYNVSFRSLMEYLILKGERL